MKDGVMTVSYSLKRYSQKLENEDEIELLDTFDKRMQVSSRVYNNIIIYSWFHHTL